MESRLVRDLVLSSEGCQYVYLSLHTSLQPCVGAFAKLEDRATERRRVARDLRTCGFAGTVRKALLQRKAIARSRLDASRLYMP